MKGKHREPEGSLFSVSQRPLALVKINKRWQNKINKINKDDILEKEIQALGSGHTLATGVMQWIFEPEWRIQGLKPGPIKSLLPSSVMYLEQGTLATHSVSSGGRQGNRLMRPETEWIGMLLPQSKELAVYPLKFFIWKKEKERSSLLHMTKAEAVKGGYREVGFSSN